MPLPKYIIGLIYQAFEPAMARALVERLEIRYASPFKV